MRDLFSAACTTNTRGFDLRQGQAYDRRRMQLQFKGLHHGTRCVYTDQSKLGIRRYYP